MRGYRGGGYRGVYRTARTVRWAETARMVGKGRALRRARNVGLMRLLLRRRR